MVLNAKLQKQSHPSPRKRCWYKHVSNGHHCVPDGELETELNNFLWQIAASSGCGVTPANSGFR